MKTKRIFPSKLLASSIAAMAVGFAAQSFSQTETLVSSTITRLKGHARCSADGGKTWQMVKVGDKLVSGSMIQTAFKSDLDIVLSEPADSQTANLLTLAEDTLLSLDKIARKQATGSPEAAEEISLDLRKGTITGHVRKLTPASRYEMAFLHGVAGTREGVYALRANGELRVSSGKAFIALTDGKAAKEVAAGQHFNPATETVAAPTSQATASPATWQPAPAIAPETPAVSDQPEHRPARVKRKVQPPSTGLRRAAP